MGVKGVGGRTTDESEHFTWRDGVKVPCGKLVLSRNKNGPLEYNEYAVYDPKQVCGCMLPTPDRNGVESDRVLMELFSCCAGEHLLPSGGEVRRAEHGGGRRVKPPCSDGDGVLHFAAVLV
jgi:hypothetical protein